MDNPENPPAFPQHPSQKVGSERAWGDPGMTLRDWFAGQVLPTTSSVAPEWQLKLWFGDRTGIRADEIRAKAAYAIADAMLAARSES